MFCKACGTEIPTGAPECPKCGKAVETIVVAEDNKPESVATAAPQPAAEAAPEKKQKRKSSNLTLPVVLLVISIGGLVYMYIDGTFKSILSWFTSEGEEKMLRPEINTGTDPIELFGNIGILVVSAILVIVAIIGLISLFKRLGRKFSSKD